MYWGFTIPELIVIFLLFLLALGTLVAALNKDAINYRISNLFNWFEDGFYEAGGWFSRLLYSIFLYPARFSQNIKHDGWRNGMTIGAISLSAVIFSGLLGLFLFIGIGFIIITIVLWILGSILGSGSN